MSLSRWIVGAALSVVLATGAVAQTLPLPGTLVDGRSAEGRKLLFESEASTAYMPLSASFVTQKFQSYCGVASIVMVLNALQIPAPAVPEYDPYHIFTQDNVLDGETDKILPREVLAKMGMTLDQLGGLIARFGLKADVRHAGDTDLATFRAEAQQHLEQGGSFVVVNYLRMAIGQEKGGHISPIAAYDKESDRFLVMDVARYKYPPVWVSAADLFGAMNTVDKDNAGRTRGYVLISRLQ